MKILTAPRMERCIGCHSCSLACARLVHKIPVVGHGRNPDLIVRGPIDRV